jgi:hypothetical protein
MRVSTLRDDMSFRRRRQEASAASQPFECDFDPEAAGDVRKQLGAVPTGGEATPITSAIG